MRRVGAARLNNVIKPVRNFLRIPTVSGGFYIGKRTTVSFCSIIAGILGLVALSVPSTSFLMVFAISVILIFASIVWVLSEDLSGIKFLIIPALPILYFASYILLANLLVLQPLGILAAAVALGTSFYFLLLTQNIYNIASHRSIGLVRAANVSGTLFTVITAFFAYGVVWTKNLPFWFLAPLIFLISFLLFFLAIWSLHLEEKFDSRTLSFTAILALVLAETGIALSFWPVLPLITALVLSIEFYVLFGLTQFELQERLTRRVVSEYLVIAGVVLFLILVTTRWGG